MRNLCDIEDKDMIVVTVIICLKNDSELGDIYKITRHYSRPRAETFY